MNRAASASAWSITPPRSASPSPRSMTQPRRSSRRGWITGSTRSTRALLEDPATAIGMFFLDMLQDNLYSETCTQACLDAAAQTSKPVVLATNSASLDHQRRAVEVTHAGVPVLDGTVPALRAVRHAL